MFTLLLATALGAAACGTEPTDRVAEAGAPRSCPKGVLTAASVNAPVNTVLSAAQRLLSRRRYGSQGTIYHLTPRNAPIDEVVRVATLGGAFDDTQPGLRAIHRAGARQCGESTAQASWAIHYWIPVSVIASAGGWVFIVKTKFGWKFWGNWCGAGKSPKWRERYCS